MNRDLAIGAALLLSALMLWAGNAVITRAAMVGDVPPLVFNFLRWALAFLMFLPFTAARVWRERQVFVDQWRYFTIFALVSITLFNSLYYVGLQYTTAIQGSLILALLPVVVLISVVVLLRQSITTRQVIGVLLSILGAAVIILRGDPTLVQTLALNVGDLWCFAAVIVWSWQILLMRRKPAALDMASFMTVVIGIGVILQAPLAWWEVAVAGRTFVPTTQNLLFVGYVALFAAVIGTTMYNAGVYRLGPANSGNLGNLYPLFTAVLAIIFLGEPLETFHVWGGILVLGGVFMATFARPEKR